MSLFNRIFGRDQSLKDCPRCLGKGHVDWDDIKRLDQELKWIPGTCAYCNGRRKVNKKVEDNIPVDTAYLVMNLPESERKNIINGHPDALERANRFEEKFELLINQICYLHFETNLNPLQIAKLFLIGKEDLASHENEKEELVDYVERVIKKKANKN